MTAVTVAWNGPTLFATAATNTRIAAVAAAAINEAQLTERTVANLFDTEYIAEELVEFVLDSNHPDTEAVRKAVAEALDTALELPGGNDGKPPKRRKVAQADPAAVKAALHKVIWIGYKRALSNDESEPRPWSGLIDRALAACKGATADTAGTEFATAVIRAATEIADPDVAADAVSEAIRDEWRRLFDLGDGAPCALCTDRATIAKFARVFWDAQGMTTRELGQAVKATGRFDPDDPVIAAHAIDRRWLTVALASTGLKFVPASANCDDPLGEGGFAHTCPRCACALERCGSLGAETFCVECRLCTAHATWTNFCERLRRHDDVPQDTYEAIVTALAMHGVTNVEAITGDRAADWRVVAAEVSISKAAADAVVAAATAAAQWRDAVIAAEA